MSDIQKALDEALKAPSKADAIVAFLDNLPPDIYFASTREDGTPGVHFIDGTEDFYDMAYRVRQLSVTPEQHAKPFEIGDSMGSGDILIRVGYPKYAGVTLLAVAMAACFVFYLLVR